MRHDPSAVDDNERIACILGSKTHLSGGDGTVFRRLDHIQRAVRFQYGVFDLMQVEDSLRAQSLGQLVRCETVFPHLALVDPTAHDEQSRLAGKYPAQLDAFER